MCLGILFLCRSHLKTPASIKPRTKINSLIAFVNVCCVSENMYSGISASGCWFKSGNTMPKAKARIE
jgi:hypothetical protein